jgi:hypothetical protein
MVQNPTVPYIETIKKAFISSDKAILKVLKFFLRKNLIIVDMVTRTQVLCKGR